MDTIIGIDLGTTNSCAATIGDRVIIIPISNNNVMPSVVSIINGNITVGANAKRQIVSSPRNTVHSVKRLLGRRIDDVDIVNIKDFLSYQIEPDDKKGIKIRIDNKTFSPIEISAMILKKIKESAEEYLGEPVKEAVITVPAYFDDNQRQATKDAGRIAGLDVKRIINEPTAAALAYEVDTTKHKTIAVYDFGGGTFDISIIKNKNGTFEVLSTNGNTHLGGNDLDMAIFELLKGKIIQQYKDYDFDKDIKSIERVKEAAEKAKRELSFLDSIEINLPFLTKIGDKTINFSYKITQKEMRDIITPLIRETEEYCQIAIRDAKIEKKDIDEIILVGGQTKSPIVQDIVEKFFGKKPNKRPNPDEVVASGASIQGAILSQKIKNVLLMDVIPISLGIELKDGTFHKLIIKNTHIPTSTSDIFTTAADNQPSVDIHILQGENDAARYNKSIGRFTLSGIPPAPKGYPQIKVMFSIDANGLMSISARDIISNKERKITIKDILKLTEEEIKRSSKKINKKK